MFNLKYLNLNLWRMKTNLLLWVSKIINGFRIQLILPVKQENTLQGMWTQFHLRHVGRIKLFVNLSLEFAKVYWINIIAVQTMCYRNKKWFLIWCDFLNQMEEPKMLVRSLNPLPRCEGCGGGGMWRAGRQKGGGTLGRSHSLFNASTTSYSALKANVTAT